MKKIIPALFAIALISSCTTDFDLEADWQDIPIVYAFVSIQDTAHYVRIQKAFLEPGGNAFDIATVSDSIYYDNINVQLEKIETGELFDLQAVDGASEGYPKDDGLFANAPNILYKIDAESVNLEGEDEIRLIINRANGLTPVTAETIVVGIIDSVPAAPALTIGRWRYTENRSFGWKTDPNNKIFDLRLVIKYREATPDNPTEFIDKTLEWVVDEAIINDDDDDRLSYPVVGNSFYNFIGQNIPVQEGVVRFFDGFDMYVTGAGEELLEFVRVSQANTGITSAQSIPTYTNVSDGLGIFTSRYQMYRPNIRLISEARDSLIDGIFTKDLGFK